MEAAMDHDVEPGPQWECMNPAHDRCYVEWLRGGFAGMNMRRRTP